MAIQYQYTAIIKIAVIAAGGIGVPGAFSFGLDVSALSATWVTMILAIAKESGHAIDRSYAIKVAAGVLTGLGAYLVGSKILTHLLHIIPGAGTLASIGINSFLNALFTYKMGKAVSALFDTGGFEGSNTEDMIKILAENIIPHSPLMLPLLLMEANEMVLMIIED